MTACGITRQMASRLRQFSQLQKVNQASILTPNSDHIKRNLLILEPRSIKLIHSSSIRNSNVEEDNKKAQENMARWSKQSTSESEETTSNSPQVKELQATIEELEISNTELKSKYDDIMDKYRRSIAESDNMRKRLTKQIEDAKIFGIQGFSKDILEVADVLDKAVGMGVESQSVEDLHQGLKMTQAQLLQVFKRHGLETIDPLNEKFDPNKHDALFQIPDPDKEPNTVVNVQKVGYSLHGRTIRPASVGVSRK